MLIFYQQTIVDSHGQAHAFDYLLGEITEMKTKQHEVKYYYYICCHAFVQILNALEEDHKSYHLKIKIQHRY